ncbi:PREDICTED: C3 and PZP-like alpha-2-macroglobulin domain-containing protein 8 [Priapulus caudatus]|uniref:C3 and PZP-like alpha-2-macroglobulin domain-containing protein 8 n=1 Tax=Priapulus caudatus TaxID=37621 RepID=A0ABM1E5A6_PRICU|nr:PREDICTED: C3 and PZP-like alpha-2-macroglobulin domain-containing protein 8 [Priapulus caudatus]
MLRTSFVAISIHQAPDHIYIAHATIKRALCWIVLHQGEHGSFPEPGRIIHTDMQEGAAGGIPLSAYTLNALLANRRKLSSDLTKLKLDNAVRRGEKRLVSQLDVIADDPYSLPVTTYALVIKVSQLDVIA